MNKTPISLRPWRVRALSLLMAAVLVLGLIPGVQLVRPASAHWADESIAQLEEWGVLRPGQASNPDQALTRADFMAIINRAYGYTKTGPIPFTDVTPQDWFYEDVAIAYTAGYINGTSAETVSPNSTLTRETVACILGRNLMLKEVPGEIIAFSDGRDISDWSRGMIQAAVDNYLLDGYDDNSFRPTRAVTYGEMAALMTRCIGTPLQEAGDYSVGTIYGNVTITAPGVTLRDSIISGDLYVSGGVGLGSVRLENTTVLGRIIVSGAGESEGGDMSLALVNVTADEMIVDNMRNQYVTIRAEGNTNIATTSVRAPTYLQDNTPQEAGLREIVLEGESGTQLDLAGRIKSVTNKTPLSTIKMAKGSAQKITVDEAATGAQLLIERGASVREVNLDVATQVLGSGDVDKLNVNAPGSIISMLPDDIYIRPGISANINGQDMDANAAEEASESPRLLTGYPAARDVAPTSLKAAFATNKRGTVYWAVSPIADGSVSAEDLISPPTYGSLAVANGSVLSPTATTETVVNVTTGLTVGGAYYLTAIMVDGRGERSPLKVTAFVTPDNTKPAFVNPPVISQNLGTSAQAFFIPNKDCKLYYVVYPKGAQAPTISELRSQSITGAVDYGIRDVEKNTETYLDVRNLEELKEYDLYLWLCDADGVNYMDAPFKLSFKSADITKPAFEVEMAQKGEPQDTTASVTATLNEDGFIYYVLVPPNTLYPKPENASDPNPAPLDSQYAINQVVNGVGAYNGNTSGSRGVAVKAHTESSEIRLNRLTKETAYDLYYVGMDAAGNYTDVHYLSVYTRDDAGPTVYQYFGGDHNKTLDPMANESITLEFSEDIRVAPTSVRATTGESLRKLYTDSTRRNDFLSDLKQGIVLYYLDENGNEQPCKERSDKNDNDTDWVIDYRNVTLTPVKSSNKILIEFPNIIETGTDGDGNPIGHVSALNLQSGVTYYFKLVGLTDCCNYKPSNETMPEATLIGGTPGLKDYGHTFEYIETGFARINLRDLTTGRDNIDSEDGPYLRDRDSGALAMVDVPVLDADGKPTTGADGKPVTKKENVLSDMHAQFRLMPETTDKIMETIRYELLVWTDTTIEFDLFYRIVDPSKKTTTGTNLQRNGVVTAVEIAGGHGFPCKYAGENAKPDSNGWVYLGNSGTVSPNGASGAMGGVSVNYGITGLKTSSALPRLTTLPEGLYYDFVITVTKKDDSENPAEWNSGDVNFHITAAAAAAGNLSNFDTSLSDWNYWLNSTTPDAEGNTKVRSIGLNAQRQPYQKLTKTFPDMTSPYFTMDTPTFTSGNTSVSMMVNANRDCTILWAVAEVVTDEKAGTYSPAFTTTIQGQTDNTGAIVWSKMAESGKDDLKDQSTKVSSPKNTLSAPTNTYLNDRYIKKDYDDTAIQMGTLDFKRGAQRTIPVENLKANTNYYIYFVLITTGQGDTGMSPVYSYKYTTSPETKPKIDLYNDSAAGNVQFRTQEDVPANLAYRVFNEEDVANDDPTKDLIQYLNQPFTPLKKPADPNDPNLSDEVKNFKYTYPPYYDGTNGKVKVITILDAMSTQYDASAAGWTANSDLPDSDWNGYSIFDIYGSETDKRNVDNLVRGITPNSRATASGEVETVGSVTAWTKEDIWEGNPNMYGAPSTYVLITVGHNTKSKVSDPANYFTIDSFAAVQGVTKNSLKAPDLLPFKPGKPTVSGTKVSGSLSLVFDYNLYWRSSGGGAGVPVVNMTTPYKPADPSTSPPTPEPTHVGILGGATMQGTNWGIGVTPGTTTGTSETPTTVFNIWYQNIEIGSEYIVLPGGFFGNVNGNFYTPADNMLLRIRFEEEKTGTDTPLTAKAAYVVVQWGDEEYWSDGTPLTTTPTPP